MFSGDKKFDESGWGAFDTGRDADAAWDFNSASKVSGYISFIFVIRKKEKKKVNGYVRCWFFRFFNY